MLFHVKMTVTPPNDNLDRFEELKHQEKEYAQGLQQKGVWRHLWRIAGQYQNVSIFDVRDIDHLHEVLTNLPLGPYISADITPICRHPSSIHDDDR